VEAPEEKAANTEQSEHIQAAGKDAQPQQNTDKEDVVHR